MTDGAPLDDAVAQATEEVVETVSEEAERVETVSEEATERVEEAVEEASETAARETPGTTTADVDAIADRVYQRLSADMERIMANGTTHSAPAEPAAVEAVEETAVRAEGEVTRDTVRPSQEHWWYRQRTPFGRRK